MAVNNSQINPPGNLTSPSALQPNSTMNSPRYLSETLAVLITKYIFFALLALFGVIGNGLVVLVTIKRRAFKSSLDLFVKNLAIADLGFLLLVTPSGVIRAEIPFQWPLGEFICIYIYPSVEVFHGASVWIIAAIALERYRNIVGMARIRRNSHTKRSAKLLMAVVWVFSFIVFTIPIYVAVVFKDDGGSRMCTMDWREPKGEQIGSKLYLGLLVFFSYILPLSVVIWTYVAISKQLRRSNTFLRGFKGIISRKTAKKIRKLENSVRNYEVEQSAGGSASTPGPHVQNHTLLTPVDSHRLTQNKRAKNILTPVAVLFAVSMLPINILRILLLFWTPIVLEKYYKIIFFIAVIFTAANSSLNPVVYSIVSREFRNALKSLFNQKPRALSKSSASTGLEVQESTERRRFDTAMSAPATKESEEPNMNNSRSCIVTDTKL